MYKKHQIILASLSILIGVFCCLLRFRITAISSDVISVVSISSALYLAAFAGIQASSNLREKLKEPDTIIPHRTQRFVLNCYFKVALVLNVVTIISVSASNMVADRIAQLDLLTNASLIQYILDYALKRPVQPKERLSAWVWADFILNFSSTSLFVANLIQMCFIGKFVVNRIPFDK